jgi:hypothetical protein
MKWTPSAKESEYFSILPSGLTFYLDEDQSAEITLILRSDDDRELRSVTRAVQGVEIRELAELYGLVRKQQAPTHAAVDQALGELAKL